MGKERVDGERCRQVASSWGKSKHLKGVFEASRCRINHPAKTKGEVPHVWRDRLGWWVGRDLDKKTPTLRSGAVSAGETTRPSPRATSSCCQAARMLSKFHKMLRPQAESFGKHTARGQQSAFLHKWCYLAKVAGMRRLRKPAPKVEIGNEGLTT